MSNIRLPFVRFYPSIGGETDREHVRIDGYVDLDPAQILGDLPGRLVAMEKWMATHTQTHPPASPACGALTPQPQQDAKPLVMPLDSGYDGIAIREQLDDERAKLQAAVCGTAKTDVFISGGIPSGQPAQTITTAAKPCADEAAHRFRIVWRNSEYKLSRHGYDGGEVVDAVWHDDQIAALCRELEQSDAVGRNNYQTLVIAQNRIVEMERCLNEAKALTEKLEARADWFPLHVVRDIKEQRDAARAANDRLARELAELERQPDPLILAKERDKALAELAAERGTSTHLSDVIGSRDAAIKQLEADLAAATERAEKAEESQRLTQKAREDDRGTLQQKCSDWGNYWRASDSHGVKLNIAQATELLADALGVEVEIEAHDAARRGDK